MEGREERQRKLESRAESILSGLTSPYLDRVPQLSFETFHKPRKCKPKKQLPLIYMENLLSMPRPKKTTSQAFLIT